jgi:nucleoside-diphosphate-sugar epimerase
MKKKRPGHIPSFIFRLIIGRDLFEVIQINCKVSNAKAKKMLNWKPKYPSYREGLKETIREIREKKISYNY